ncbi:MAG TPA: hypothetical protein QGF63_13975, partial [Alphaproteobacteria bacterium]|nr:hypothetical protein [Alphaproteobacteria bacterium]
MSASDNPSGPGSERDKPLSFHWCTKDAEWFAPLNLPPARSRLYDQARASILLDAIIEAAGQNRWVSYSRRAGFYTPRRRYQGTAYTFATVP